jgi:nucleotide-binding universal stress UspA family protein
VFLAAKPPETPRKQSLRRSLKDFDDALCVSTRIEKTMTTHLLVPLDGSPFAEAALPHAAALARAIGASIALLRVVRPVETSQSLFWRATMPAELRAAWEAEALTSAHTYMAEAAGRLRAEGLTVTTEIAEEPDVAAAIIACAERDTGAGMIVMTSHGRSGPGRWLLGSVAAKVLQRAPVPLLLIRPGAAEDAVHYTTIGVALDGSLAAEQALGQATLLASAVGANLVLIAVATAAEEPQLVDLERAAVDSYLAEIEARLQSSRFSVRTRVGSGDPAAELLLIAREERADLIVMATHGQQGFHPHWLGSVALRVLARADRPVLLVRAQP